MQTFQTFAAFKWVNLCRYITESSGTSYSAPLFAGMIALINDERLAKGKGTVVGLCTC
jgi:subtilase family serine protease